MNVIYTIGYEGTDIDRFMATLKLVGINMIADVRAVALSRKKGFSKTALRNRLESEGIAYSHYIELGDPKPGRIAARDGNYNEFRRIYGDHLSEAKAQNSLKRLHETSRSFVTCLLCFERDFATCHRSIVADSFRPQGIGVVNLYGDLPRRYVDFAKILPHGYSSEGAAAA